MSRCGHVPVFPHSHSGPALYDPASRSHKEFVTHARNYNDRLIRILPRFVNPRLLGNLYRSLNYPSQILWDLIRRSMGKIQVLSTTLPNPNSGYPTWKLYRQMNQQGFTSHYTSKVVNPIRNPNLYGFFPFSDRLFRLMHVWGPKV